LICAEHRSQVEAVSLPQSEQGTHFLAFQWNQHPSDLIQALPQAFSELLRYWHEYSPIILICIGIN